MTSGIGLAVLGMSLESKTQFIAILGGLTIFALSIELLRLLIPSLNDFVLGILGGLSRQHERTEISGIFYFCLGCSLSSIVFPRFISILAILYLAVGDPVAAVVGILFGKTPVTAVDIDSKSVEGSLACFFVCGLITYAATYAFAPLEFASPSHRLLFAGLGGGSAMIGELIPLKTDDNFAIPIVSGAILWLTAALLNLVPGLYLN
jgi:dolichol kinase